MTDRHDEWAPEDDELVREALMSLMEDVSSEPLPEPAQIRARAEGRAEGGQVVALDPRRNRRRSMAVLAGVAAAALVATGAGLLVVNQSPDTPVATSSTEHSTSTSTGTTAAPSKLTTLGPAEWQAVLGVPVDSTVPDEMAAHCFRPVEGTTWQSRSARLSDSTLAAGQWIGTSPEGTDPLTRSVDRSVTGCEGYTRESEIGEDITGGSFRAWHHTGPEDVDVWWVEVSDGTSVSFLAVTETDGRSYADEDIRTLALGVLGEVDLTQRSSTSSSTSSEPSTTSTPTTPSSSTSTSTATSTTTGGSPTSGSGTGTGTGSPTPPVNSPTPPDPSLPVVGEVPSSSFVQPGRWSSRALTGGEPAVGGRLELEGGGITIDPCATPSSIGNARVGGLGIRSGSGSDNFFGRQYVLQTDSRRAGDQLVRNLVGQYSTDCSGAADTRTLADDSRVDTFALVQGDLTTYVAVVRQGPTSVSVLHLTTAKTAPRPLTDATADQQLARLAGLVRG